MTSRARIKRPQGLGCSAAEVSEGQSACVRGLLNHLTISIGLTGFPAGVGWLVYSWARRVASSFFPKEFRSVPLVFLQRARRKVPVRDLCFGRCYVGSEGTGSLTQLSSRAREWQYDIAVSREVVGSGCSHTVHYTHFCCFDVAMACWLGTLRVEGVEAQRSTVARSLTSRTGGGSGR